MTIDKDLIDRLRTRGEEMFTQVSAELMSNPRFMKAMAGAMRGKEAAEDAAARAIKSMNIPTRTEFKKALKRIDALENDLTNLEAKLKMIPLVGQACAIGDNRPFVSALVVLDPDVAPAWAEKQGIEYSDLADLAAKPEVQSAIETGLTEAMAEFNNAERVKKVTVLGAEWLPDSDELTPTSKLKRRGIHENYADEIEAMYER